MNNYSQFVVDLKKREEYAWEELIERYRQRSIRFLVSTFSLSMNSAEDVFFEVLCNLYSKESWPNTNADILEENKFIRYFLTCLKNKATDHYRKQKKEILVDSWTFPNEPVASTPDEPIAFRYRKSRQNPLSKALELYNLAPDEAIPIFLQALESSKFDRLDIQIVLWRLLTDFSFDQIAVYLSREDKNIKSSLVRKRWERLLPKALEEMLKILEK